MDYRASIDEGITAAKVAESNKTEIQNVFTSLNTQMSEHTGQKIIIEPAQLSKPLSVFAELNRTMGSMYTSSKSVDSNKYWAIVAYKEGYEKHELARWDLDKNGYPCSISYRNVSNSCENKEALERAISNLLKEPDVGKIIHKLTQEIDLED